MDNFNNETPMHGGIYVTLNKNGDKYILMLYFSGMDELDLILDWVRRTEGATPTTPVHLLTQTLTPQHEVNAHATRPSRDKVNDGMDLAGRECVFGTEGKAPSKKDKGGVYCQHKRLGKFCTWWSVSDRRQCIETLPANAIKK